MKTILGLALIAAYIAAIIGYFANIFKLVGMLGGEITAFFIGRCFGVIMPPLGTVLGFL